MKKSPSRETNSQSASQKIRRLLWNPKLLSCSQGAATGPYPESDASSPQLSDLLLYLPIYVYVFRVVSSLLNCTKTDVYTCNSSAVCSKTLTILALNIVNLSVEFKANIYTERLVTSQ
jgi:hypothetical protein